MRADCRKAPRPPAIERGAAPDRLKAEALRWRWVRARAGSPWPSLLPLRSIAEPGTSGPPASESPWAAESGSRSGVSGGGWEWRPGRRPRRPEWPGARRPPSGRRTGPAAEEPPRQGPESFSTSTSRGDASYRPGDSASARRSIIECLVSLSERLRQRISQEGPISFRDFMEAALYDPEE